MATGADIVTTPTEIYTDPNHSLKESREPQEQIPPPDDWCNCPECTRFWHTIAQSETAIPLTKDLDITEETLGGPRKEALQYRADGGLPGYNTVIQFSQYAYINGSLTSGHYGGQSLVVATTGRPKDTPFAVCFNPTYYNPDLSLAILSRTLHSKGATIQGRTPEGYADNTPTYERFPNLRSPFPRNHALHEVPIPTIETVEDLQQHLYIEYSLLLAAMNGKLPWEVLPFLYHKVNCGIAEDDLNQILTAINNAMPSQRGRHLRLLESKIQNDKIIEMTRELLLIPTDNISRLERQRMIADTLSKSNINPELIPLLEEIVTKVRNDIGQITPQLINQMTLVDIRSHMQRIIDTKKDDLSFDIDVDPCLYVTFVGLRNVGKTTCGDIIEKIISYAQKKLSGKSTLQCACRDLDPYASTERINALARSGRLDGATYVRYRKGRAKMGKDFDDFDPPFVVHQILSNMGITGDKNLSTVDFIRIRKPTVYFGAAAGSRTNQPITSMEATAVLSTDLAIHTRIPAQHSDQHSTEEELSRQLRQLTPPDGLVDLENGCYGHTRFEPPYVYRYLEMLQNPAQDPVINQLTTEVLSLTEEAMTKKEHRLRTVAQELFTHLHDTHDTPIDTKSRKLFLQLDGRTKTLIALISDQGLPRIKVRPQIMDTIARLWFWIAEQVES